MAASCPSPFVGQSLGRARVRVGKGFHEFSPLPLQLISCSVLSSEPLAGGVLTLHKVSVRNALLCRAAHLWAGVCVANTG